MNAFLHFYINRLNCLKAVGEEDLDVARLVPVPDVFPNSSVSDEAGAGRRELRRLGDRPQRHDSDEERVRVPDQVSTETAPGLELLLSHCS